MKNLTIVTPVFDVDDEFHATRESIESQLLLGDASVDWIVVEKNQEYSLKSSMLKNGIHLSHYKYKDSGEYDAINFGIKKSRNNFIMIICAGDIFKSEKIISLVQKNLIDHQMVYSYGIEYEDRNKKKIVRRWFPRWTKDSWKYGEMLPHPGLVVHKSMYEKVGEYNSKYSVVADYDFEIRLLVKFQSAVQTIPEIIVSMSTGGRSYHGFMGSLSQQIQSYKILKANGLKFPLSYFLKPFLRWRQYFE